MPLDRWLPFTNTILHFGPADGLVVDLRESVPASLGESLAGLGLAGEFGILTAFNPDGVPLGEEENTSRQKLLELRLEEFFIRVDACSPDRSHCECSVAVLAPCARLVAVARDWNQVAIFWWDLESFWIIAAAADFEPVRLPRV